MSIIKTTLISLLLIFSSPLLAEESKHDLKAFAQDYFAKWVATQMPDATEATIDAYLSLLQDNVGHTHLPWDDDDSRHDDGKTSMKEGMLYYMGAHTSFKAELLNAFTFNETAVAIRYIKHAKGIHPQNGQAIEYTQTIMEVLEIEDGKVAILRKYHE